MTGKFNFGVGTEGVDSGTAVPQVGEAVHSLFGQEVSHHQSLRLQKCH